MADDISVQLEGAVESLGRFRDSLEDTNIRMGNASSIEAKITKLEKDKLGLLQKANKMEGKRLKDLSKGVGGAVKGMGQLAKKLGIVGGILTAFQGFVNVVLKVNKHTALMAKLMGNTRAASDRLLNTAMGLESAFINIGGTLADAVKTSAALAQEFGQASRVSGQMVKTVGEMNKAFGVSVQEGAQFVEMMERANLNSDELVENLIKSGSVAGGNLGVAMRDVVKNSQMVPLYMQRGEDAFTRMVTTSVRLGTSIDKITAVGESFTDISQVANDINVTSQLLGGGFADAVGSIDELVRMSNNFQDAEIMERVTKAAAAQLKVTDDGLQITRFQLQAVAKHYGNNQELARRAISDEIYRNKLQEKQIYNAQEMADFGEDELYDKNDITRALFKEFKITGDLLKLKELEELTEVQKAALLKADLHTETKIKAEVEKRYQARLAEKKSMTDIIRDSMTVMDKMSQLLDKLIAPLETAISDIFTEQFIDDFEKQLEGVSRLFTQLFTFDMGQVTRDMNGAVNAAGEQDKLKGIAAGFKSLADQFAFNFSKAFQLQTSSGTFINTWDGLMQHAVTKFIEYMGGATDKLGEIFAKVFRSTLSSLMGSSGGATLKKDKDIVDEALRRGGEQPLATSEEWGDNPEHLAIIANAFQQQSAADRGEAAGKPPKKEGFTDFYYDGQWIRVPQRSGTGFQLNDEEKKKNGDALGRSGGVRHRGLVGEAGTEVGITRSALRELSSAGIPGYLEGSAFGQPGRYRYAAQGSTAARARSGADSRAVSGAYRNELGMVLESQRQRDERFLDDLGRDQRDIWARNQKEFFIAYPAAVDRAFGEPFRQNGPIATGFYNAVFSGMQAGTRAELAGADKDTRRQLMYQHMAAEGLKPGGIINQGINYLGEQQREVQKIFNGGFEKEQEALIENKKTFIANSEAALKATKLYGWDSDKAKNLRDIRDSSNATMMESYKTVAELQKIKNRGDATNRALVAGFGGIQSGLNAFAGSIAAGGTREQAMEMGKRGLIGGIVEDFAGTFAAGDKGFLSTMTTMGMLMGVTPMPRNAGRNAGEMLTEAMRRTESTFQGQGYGVGWGGGNAVGRVFTSPHLAMVGEGSANEVIIPTERIRKGLPINAGVARELGSIGVPGYEHGGPTRKELVARRDKLMKENPGLPDPVDQATPSSPSYKDKLGEAWGSDVGGWKTGVGTAGMQFASTYMQTGDLGAAAGMGIGAGIGFGASIALSAIPGVGPFIGPILGPMIGSFIGGKLAGWMGKKPRYKRYRNRAIKSLEEHVLTEGLFTFGQPAGIGKNIERAIAGKDKKMASDEAFSKLVSGVTESPVLQHGWAKGISPDQLLGVLSGQVKDTTQANQIYGLANQAFYGRRMARGGVVTGPTNAVIGEAGPEAVIPLDRFGGYGATDQKKDNRSIIDELRKSNQQMGMFIKNMGDAKTVLNVDGRALAETVGSNMYDINTGM